MATGCLHYPFASGPSPLPGNRGKAPPATFVNGKSTPVPYQLGELAVERDALARVLEENPLSLNILLEEVMAALEFEGVAEAESELEEAMRFWLRTV